MNSSIRNLVLAAFIMGFTLMMAWNEWTDADVHEADGVIVVEGELAALEKVVWESEKETIVMERRKDTDGDFWWVTHTTTRMVPVQGSSTGVPVQNKAIPPSPHGSSIPNPDPKKTTLKAEALKKAADENQAAPTESVPDGNEAPAEDGGQAIEPPIVEDSHKNPPVGDAPVVETNLESETAGSPDDADAKTDSEPVADGESKEGASQVDESVAPDRKPAPVTAAPTTPTAANPTTPPKREMEAQVTTTHYKAGLNGDTLLEKLAPMVAMRKLDSGEVTFDSVCQKDKAKEVTPKATLTLTIGGNDHELSVWCQSYGTRDWYVQKIGGGGIFLVDDDVLRTLNQAKTRLADRRLWSFDTNEVVTAVIATGDGQSVQAEQPDPDKADSLGWKAFGKPINSDESKAVRKFMDAFLKLNGSSYRDQQEYETLGLDERKELQVKLVTEDQREQTVTISYDGTDWWAKSEHTHGSLKLVLAKAQPLADMAGGLTKSSAEPEASGDTEAQ